MSEETRETEGRKDVIRCDEEGTPLFLSIHNIRKFCHFGVDETTEDGDVLLVKVRPTKAWLDKLNSSIYELVHDSIVAARLDDRTEIMEDDLREI